MPTLTLNNVMKTVQGCDGYCMDLAECAECYDVTADELERWVSEQWSPWLIVITDDDGDKTIQLDGE